MAPSEQIQDRIRVMARQLAEEMGEVDESEGDCWLDAIENRAIEIGDAIAAALIAHRTEQRPPDPDESCCPECGQQGRYRGSRPRAIVTRRGPAELAEPEYYCPCCRKAFFPSDQGVRG